MNYHSMQFFFIDRTEFQSIGLNRVQTYKYITGKYFPFPVIKRDYISIVIMIQILSIHVQYIIIITKNKRDSTQFQ